MIRAVRYRVGQFFAAAGALVRPPDPTAAERVLDADLLALFGRMPPVDRLHGLRVMAALEGEGERDPLLLQAALLHDVGKAEAGVRIVHRIARVLLATGAPPLWRWLAGTPTGWRRPFWAVQNHPARGAVWVETRGAAPEVEALIRWHEAPMPGDWEGTDQGHRHAALARVDARL